jgi:hypothetical protein
MILFINGPFGVGKTTVARLLVQKLPRTILYDPEIIGGVLHRVLGPLTKVEDYQDYTLWRRLVVGGARLSRRVSGRTMVIPMTVRRRDAFDPLVEGLRRVDPNLWWSWAASPPYRRIRKLTRGAPRISRSARRPCATRPSGRRYAQKALRPRSSPAGS